jgi:hypothetical protein
MPFSSLDSSCIHELLEEHLLLYTTPSDASANSILGSSRTCDATAFGCL